MYSRDTVGMQSKVWSRLSSPDGEGLRTKESSAASIGDTGIQFAALMRALYEEDGGTFVGLNTTRP